MQQHKLPTYFNPLHSYHAVDTSEHGGNGINIAPRRFSWRLLLVLFLPPFLIISGLWFKTHPTFAEDLSIALELSVDAHITLHPNIIPFETASTQDTPVPQVDAAILGEATPKWTAKASASIPAFPRAINLSPNAPKADEILFVMATNADRAISSARWWLWPSYLKNPSSPCFVLLPPTDAHRVLDVEAEFRKQGLECIAKASHDPVYQHRVLSLPGEAKRHMGERMNSIRWLIMGDDDTLWLDKNGLQRLLGEHDDQQMKFIASTSERIVSLGYFGRMSFGGGGLLMSSALVSKYIEVLPECLERWPNTFGGDEAVNNCAALAQGISNREEAYINEPGMHQFDINGYAFGFLESGVPIMNMHHFFSWAKIMPEWMHNNDNYRVLKLLTDAAHFLGQDNMFKRYSLDGGRTILVNGYSITNYYEPLTPEDLSKMEWTWIYTDEYKLANEKVRPPIRAIRHQMEPYMVQGKQWKSPYFLHKLKNVDKQRGRATFIYRNEQGKEITIDWVE